jgi:hypothetical protein
VAIPRKGDNADAANHALKQRDWSFSAWAVMRSQAGKL